MDVGGARDRCDLGRLLRAVDAPWRKSQLKRGVKTSLREGRETLAMLCCVSADLICAPNFNATISAGEGHERLTRMRSDALEDGLFSTSVVLKVRERDIEVRESVTFPLRIYVASENRERQSVGV